MSVTGKFVGKHHVVQTCLISEDLPSLEPSVLSFFFVIEVELIHSLVLVSGIQQSD